MNSGRLSLNLQQKTSPFNPLPTRNRMDVQAYLQRIRYDGALDVSIHTLRGLHRAHLYAVPFENLSIHSGERIPLDREWIYDKIVNRYRGGFCYECNGLFSWLLRELGFEVTLLSARVRNSVGEGFGPEYDHLVLRVDLDEPWLADVGFGESFLEPLRLNERGEQTQPEGRYKLEQQGSELVYYRVQHGKWQPQHVFTLQPRRFAEFAGMCHFHQTSPRSPFPQKWFITRAMPGGRVTLSQRRLILTRNGVREERPNTGRETTARWLARWFGVLGVSLFMVRSHP